MAIPVVTTPEGAEGIGAEESILAVAKNNEDYAKKVIESGTFLGKGIKNLVEVLDINKVVLSGRQYSTDFLKSQSVLKKKPHPSRMR